MTLARRALLEDGRLTLDARPGSARRPVGRRCAARADRDLRARDPRADLKRYRGARLAHITGGGLLNLRRIGTGVGYSITEPLPSPPVFELIASLGGSPRPRCGGLQPMGSGLWPCVPADQAAAAVGCCPGYPSAERLARSGRVTDEAERGRRSSMGMMPRCVDCPVPAADHPDRVLTAPVGSNHLTVPTIGRVWMKQAWHSARRSVVAYTLESTRSAPRCRRSTRP